MKRFKNVYIIIVWKNLNLYKKDREFFRGLDKLRMLI